MEVVSYKDIEPGTELSISYTPLNLLTADRQDIIQSWGFKCKCALCSSPTASWESDRNRRRIQDILEEMDHNENREYENMEELTEEMLGLISTESLNAQIGDFYLILSRVYLEMGYTSTARKFGNKAMEKLTEYVGSDSEKVRQAVALLRDIERAVRK